MWTSATWFRFKNNVIIKSTFIKPHVIHIVSLLCMSIICMLHQTFWNSISTNNDTQLSCIYCKIYCRMRKDSEDVYKIYTIS